MSSSNVSDSERSYFDRIAANSNVTPVSRRTLDRYANPGKLFPLERMYGLIGDVAGKSILDVGCGEGENVVVLAKFGARVTGIDISPGAIEVARRRCTLNGVAADLICDRIENLSTQDQYDIIFIDALLHHVLHDLDGVVGSLARLMKPGGMVVMAEPINLSPTLRRVRLMIGTPKGTPDERPLEPPDIDVIRRNFPSLRIEYYRCLGRLERNSRPRLNRLLAVADRLILSVPFLRRTASIAVMNARNGLT